MTRSSITLCYTAAAAAASTTAHPYRLPAPLLKKYVLTARGRCFRFWSLMEPVLFLVNFSLKFATFSVLRRRGNVCYKSVAKKTYTLNANPNSRKSAVPGAHFPTS